MKKITSITLLRESILILEIEQENKRLLLKEEFFITYENLKPVNLLKKKLHDILTDPDLKTNLINGVMSITAGYLTKKAVIGKTDNQLKQWVGTLIQIGVTRLVSKNAASIKIVGQSVIQNLFSKNQAPD